MPQSHLPVSFYSNIPNHPVSFFTSFGNIEQMFRIMQLIYVKNKYIFAKT